VLRLPHVVTGVTQELANELAKFSRAGATRVVPCVVHQPEHIADFPPEPPLRLVGVGLLIARKNPLLAIDTIGWLRQQGVDVTYTWVGAGPLMPDARERVRGLGLEEFVTFPGAVEPSQVQPMVEQAHLFFVPSAQENFFTAVAEAIAVGRPAVVPRTGGFTEYCSPNNSELVDDLRAEVLGAAIANAWARFRDSSPSQVAATIEDRFSPHRVAKDFLRLYEELARRG
jgi:glycosyltransferase involved in cell wall biosynthesis